MRTLALLIAATSVAGVSAVHQDRPSSIVVGDTIYVSTVVAEGDDGDRQHQMAGLLEKVDAALREHGSSASDIVHAQVVIKNPSDLTAVDAAFAAQYRGVEPPARTILVGEPPQRGGQFSLQAIAVRSGTPRRALRPSGWADPKPGESYAVLAADTLYLSGLVGSDPRTGNPVGGELSLQVKAIMDHAGELLRAGGMTYDNLVSSRVWVRDMAKFGEMNEIYRGYWREDRPTRATIQSNGLSPFDVGITFVAVNGRREIIVPANADGTPGLIGPNFSPAIKVGSRLFVSGNTGATSSNREDVAGQSQEALDKIGRVLAAAGYSFKDVRFTETWLTNVTHLPLAAREVEQVFNQSPMPARSVVGIPSLAGRSTLVEIAVVASR